MSLKFGRLIAAAVAGGLLAVTGTASAARDYYVDADASSPVSDGFGWCTAFHTLQEVLGVPPVPGDRILIADGTYTPDPATSGDPRQATFQLISNVTIEGGYAGCGAVDPNERNPWLYETILSGDLSGDDFAGGDNSENCYHVVTGSGTNATAVLDGVTITGGNADGVNDPDDIGGGVFNDAGHPTLINCTITGNTAAHGGAAVYNFGSGPTLIDCVIARNSTPSLGAGLFDYSFPGEWIGSTLINCLIANNVSGSYGGGGVYSDVANTSLENCTISGNTTVSIGAGIFAQGGTVSITNCILWGNVGFYGMDEGAQAFAASSTTLVVNTTCVQGWTGDLGGSDNFGLDPLFVPGPAGCLYLSQTAAGEPADSPCIDAGNDTAASLGFDDTVTTRSDEGADQGLVDLGYHYPVTGESFLMGDFDRSGDVSLDDYTDWPTCMTDPDAGDALPCCRLFDFDYDADVDLVDFAEFAISLDFP